MSMRKNLMVYMLASLLLSVVSLAFGREAELKEPAPIVPPQGITLERLDKIVDLALLQKGWVKKKIISEAPRIVEAEYATSAHRIIVRLKYDLSKLQFTYYNSDNLNFNYSKRKNTTYIHPKYMEWTQQLADQIKSNFQLGDADFTDKSISSSLAQMAAPKLPDDVPKESLAHFSNFKLERATINPKYKTNKGNARTAVNLDHNLTLALKPKLDKWKKNGNTRRTLIIKPHIAAVRFISEGTRFFVGAMVGRSWIYIKVQLIDETGDVIAEPEFYRLAKTGNGITLAREDYKMVEDAAADIASYMENNYSNAVGGGAAPPQKIRSEL